MQVSDLLGAWELALLQPGRQGTMAGGKKAHKGSSSGGSGASGKGSKGSLAVKWPEGGGITRSWLRQLATALDHASRNLPPEELPSVIPVETADAILMSAHKLLQKERNVVRVEPAGSTPAPKAAASEAGARGESSGFQDESHQPQAETRHQPLNGAASTTRAALGTVAGNQGGAEDAGGPIAGVPNAREVVTVPASDGRGEGEGVGIPVDGAAQPCEGPDRAAKGISGGTSEREEAQQGAEQGSTGKVARGNGHGQGGEGKEAGEEEEQIESGSAEWEQETPAAATSNVEVVVVGDVHGQLHDVMHMLKLIGDPGPQRYCVFNGDYVDRGAWGVETYLYLLAWKVLPSLSPPFTRPLLLQYGVRRHPLFSPPASSLGYCLNLPVP